MLCTAKTTSQKMDNTPIGGVYFRFPCSFLQHEMMIRSYFYFQPRTVHFCVDCLKKSQFWISQIHCVDKEKHIDSGLWALYPFNFIYVGRWDVSWSAWTPPCHSSTFLRFLWVFHSDFVQNINFIQLQSHWSKNYSQPDILEVSLHNFEVTFKLLEFGESFQDLIFHQLW